MALANLDRDSFETAQEYVWRLAIEFYNSHLTRKHPIDLNRAKSDPVKHPFCNLQVMLQAAVATSRSLDANNKSSPRSRVLSSALRELRRYAPILDVFTQGQPCAVSACWGMIRLILEVAGRGVQFGEELLGSVARIVRRISTFNAQLDFLFSKGESLEAFAKLYACLINYLYRASRHCTASKLRRAFEAVRNKLRDIDIQIDRLAAEVEAQFTTRSTVSQDKFAASHLQAWKDYCTLFTQRTLIEDKCHQQLILHVEDSAKMLKYLDSKIHAVHKDWRQQTDTDTDHENHKWLTQDLDPSTSFPRAEHETCAWFGDHPRHIEWLASGCDGPLYVIGPSGCGKTSLSFVVESIARERRRIVVHVSFAQPTNGCHSPVSSLLLSTLGQLLLHESVILSPTYPSIRAIVSRYRAYACRPATSMPIKTLFRFFDLITSHCPPFLLIVDGLNQLKDGPTTTFHTEAEQALSLLDEVSRRQTISVILFSRPRDWIARKMEDCVHLEITRTITNADIHIFIEAWLKRYPAFTDFEDMITTEVLSKVNGDFLYADLLLNVLASARAPADLFSTISEAPDSIVDFYEKLRLEKETALNRQDQERRRKILLMVTGSTVPLTVTEVSEVLSCDTSKDLKDVKQSLWNPAESILDLGEPFLSIDSGLVHFRHPSAREFVSKRLVTLDDGNAFMLNICLSKLIEVTFTELKYVIKLLVDNLLIQCTKVHPLCSWADNSGLYEHATRHWHEYLLPLKELSPQLWEKLRTFLHSNAFVSWSEFRFILESRSGLDAQVGVGIAITNWYRERGSDSDRPDIGIDTYFIQPYQSVSQQLAESSEDPILQYLALMRPGHYLNLGGRTAADFMQALAFKKRVVEGFTKYLGPRDRNTLLARRVYYQELSGFEKYDEALEGYRDILRVQREDLDENMIDIYDTLQWVGFTEYALARLEDAQEDLNEAVEGYKRINGEESRSFLVAYLFLGYAIEASGKFEEAASVYSSIYKEWIPVNGSASGFSTGILSAYGSLLRKQGEFNRAGDYLLEAFGTRLRLNTLENRNTIDAGLHLAVLYRQMRRRDDAAAFLHVIQDSEVFNESYERKCQLVHIGALLAFDGGEYEGPRDALTKLVANSVGKNREKNNREVLWVKLDLADARRAHDDDVGNVPFLFDELVISSQPASSRRSSLSSSWSRISDISIEVIKDSPRELDIAERALRFIRDMKFIEAANLLAANELKWAREKDFWIISGGPKVDTEFVRYGLPEPSVESLQNVESSQILRQKLAKLLTMEEKSEHT